MKSKEALLARAAVLGSILVSCLVAEVSAADRTWIFTTRSLRREHRICASPAVHVRVSVRSRSPFPIC